MWFRISADFPSDRLEPRHLEALLRTVPVAITMAVPGHSNAGTTLEIYTRVAPEPAREAADAMDRVMVLPQPEAATRAFGALTPSGYLVFP